MTMTRTTMRTESMSDHLLEVTIVDRNTAVVHPNDAYLQVCHCLMHQTNTCR